MCLPSRQATPADEGRRLIGRVLNQRMPGLGGSQLIGVSRTIAHEWISRHRELRCSGLEDGSCAFVLYPIASRSGALRSASVAPLACASTPPRNDVPLTMPALE